MRACPCCGNMLGASSYPETKSPFFPDGHLTICGNCLDEQLVDVNGEWATMDYICEWADVPFIPEQFTKVWDSCPEHTVSQYLKLFDKLNMQDSIGQLIKRDGRKQLKMDKINYFILYLIKKNLIACENLGVVPILMKNYINQKICTLV